MTQQSQWIEQVSELPVDVSIDQANACHISAVAANSPAHSLGLQKGDLLLQVDGKHISQDALMTYLADNQESVTWLFYLQERATCLKVVSKSIPLGFDDENSTPRILDNFREGNFEEGIDFERLWQRQDWKALNEAADELSFDNGFVNFVRKFKKDWLLGEATLFKGAALYELGQEQEGVRFIDLFLEQVANNHTSSTHAISYYYLARWAELNNDPSNQQHWLEYADQSNRGVCAVIDKEVQSKYEGLPVAPFRWKNQELPMSYELDRLEGSGRVSLAATLASMKDHEVLPVCVMPAYRGNGPYDDIMRCYRATYEGVAHRVKPMHVITNVTEKRSDRAFWYENEDLARTAGVPFEVLYDPGQSVSDSLEQEFSPVCYILNKEGIVCSEISPDTPSKMWELLNFSH